MANGVNLMSNYLRCPTLVLFIPMGGQNSLNNSWPIRCYYWCLESLQALEYFFTHGSKTDWRLSLSHPLLPPPPRPEMPVTALCCGGRPSLPSPSWPSQQLPWPLSPSGHFWPWGSLVRCVIMDETWSTDQLSYFRPIQSGKCVEFVRYSPLIGIALFEAPAKVTTRLKWFNVDWVSLISVFLNAAADVYPR